MGIFSQTLSLTSSVEFGAESILAILYIAVVIDSLTFSVTVRVCESVYV